MCHLPPSAALNRRRTVLIDHTARLGGGEVALFNLVRAFDRERYVPVVLLFADGPLREKLVAAGVKTHVLPLHADISDARKDALGGRSVLKIRSALRFAVFVWRTRDLLLRLRPDVVHTNSLKADIIGGIAGRLAGVPVVWHVRDRISEDYLPPRVVRVFRWLAQRVPHRVIANSKATLGTLTRQTRGVAIPSGIDDSTWRVIHDGVTDAGAEGGGAADGTGAGLLTVGLVGRLARWKGQHVFIEAARRLHGQFPNARFQVIGSALFGEDEYAAELIDAVERNGLGDVVEFTGFRADVAAAIAALDVLVHASITGEPFGQVIVEGMTAGKPVVATNGGGVPEIVQDGTTGFLVPMGDADAMAAAVGRLLADAGLRVEMGRRGRQRVTDHFTIRRTADRVQQVYDDLLGNRPGRA